MNSSLGSCGDAGVIIWKACITWAKDTGQSPASGGSAEASFVTTLHHSSPTRSAAFLSSSEHTVIGHWKKALRDVGDSQALNRALLGDRKKKKKNQIGAWEPTNTNLLLPRIESYQKGLFKLFLRQQKKKNPKTKQDEGKLDSSEYSQVQFY